MDNKEILDNKEIEIISDEEVEQVSGGDTSPHVITPRICDFCGCVIYYENRYEDHLAKCRKNPNRNKEQ